MVSHGGHPVTEPLTRTTVPGADQAGRCGRLVAADSACRSDRTTSRRSGSLRQASCSTLKLSLSLACVFADPAHHATTDNGASPAPLRGHAESASWPDGDVMLRSRILRLTLQGSRRSSPTSWPFSFPGGSQRTTRGNADRFPEPVSQPHPVSGCQRWCRGSTSCGNTPHPAGGRGWERFHRTAKSRQSKGLLVAKRVELVNRS